MIYQTYVNYRIVSDMYTIASSLEYTKMYLFICVCYNGVSKNIVI